jgi:hypothetical protein
MTTLFQVFALSSRDPSGQDAHAQPKLPYPDALMSAKQLKHEGTAFRVLVEGECTKEQTQSFLDLGALI